MSDRQEFSVDAARQAAERGELGEWVGRFLASPGSDNAPLAEELCARMHSWIGPVPLPIDRLHRLAGPPGHPVLCPIDEDEWRDDVDELEEHIDRGWEPPPVIVTYRDDQLVLEDGNHRVEGLRRNEVGETWAVVGFESAEDRERFSTPAGA
jgi:hypothetical protein